MTPERLDKIRQRTERYEKQANRILEGDGAYDGADGARIVADVCDMLLEIEKDMRPFCGPLPPVAGRESP
jgi:hypothetical protein